MRTRSLPRRSFLRGAAGVTLALPWLEARAQAPTKRFLVFFSPNGTIMDEWRPVGTETSFTLRRILAPLREFQSKMLVISGVDNQVGHATQAGKPHPVGMGTMLTGRALSGRGSGLSTGISVDQEIAKLVGGGSPLASLHVGWGDDANGDPRGHASYLGSSRPVTPDRDVTSVFNKLFSSPNFSADGTVNRAALDNLMLERRSVLDAVKDDFAALKRKLGRADNLVLDSHANSVLELERSLLTVAAAGPGCRKPAAPETSDRRNPANAKVMADLLVMALACGRTNVGGLQMSRASSNTSYGFLGVGGGHHNLSHSDNSNREQLTKINVWYAEQLAHLARGLEAIKEGGRSALDNTVILWANELSAGGRHTLTDMPYLLLGGGGLGLRTGRFVRYTNRPPHNNLLLSLLQLYGSQATSFGDPRYCSGTLPNLT